MREISNMEPNHSNLGNTEAQAPVDLHTLSVPRIARNSKPLSLAKNLVKMIETECYHDAQVILKALNKILDHSAFVPMTPIEKAAPLSQSLPNLPLVPYVPTWIKHPGAKIRTPRHYYRTVDYSSAPFPLPKFPLGYSRKSDITGQKPLVESVSASVTTRGPIVPVPSPKPLPPIPVKNSIPLPRVPATKSVAPVVKEKPRGNLCKTIKESKPIPVPTPASSALKPPDHAKVPKTTRRPSIPVKLQPERSLPLLYRTYPKVRFPHDMPDNEKWAYAESLVLPPRPVSPSDSNVWKPPTSVKSIKPR